jgi:hypothetical protein
LTRRGGGGCCLGSPSTHPLTHPQRIESSFIHPL